MMNCYGVEYNEYKVVLDRNKGFPDIMWTVLLSESDIEALQSMKKYSIHNDFVLYREKSGHFVDIRELYNKTIALKPSGVEVKAWKFLISENLFRVLGILQSLKTYVSLYEFIHQILKAEEK